MTHAALGFLQKLDPRPTATFNIETFTDAPKGTKKPKPDPLCRRFPNQTLKQVKDLLPEMKTLNQRGTAIYVMVNQCDGQRSKANVIRIRGVHADLDGISDQNLDAIRERLKPTLEVQSSEPHNWHFYWLLDKGEEISPDLAETINRGLVELGADKGAIDISRLLRLPGFCHMKHGSRTLNVLAPLNGERPPLVSLKAVGPRYTAETIISVLPHASPQPIHSFDAQNPEDAHLPFAAEQYKSQIDAAKTYFLKQHSKLWRGEWEEISEVFGNGPHYESQSDADLALMGYIVRHLAEQPLPKEHIPSLAEALFGLSGLAKRDKWQNRADYRQRTIRKACSGLTPVGTPNGHQGQVDWSAHGDIRNARFFAKIWRDRLLYVDPTRKWLKWSDERWNWCDLGQEVGCAKYAAEALYARAGEVLATGNVNGSTYARDAVKAHNHQQIKSMLDLAKSEPGMAIKSIDLDPKRRRLGVKNGVVDLSSGALRRNDPKFLITRYCDAEYDKKAACDRWLQFLDEVFQDDKEIIRTVHLLLGYTLTGEPTEEKMIFCVGHGSNGKSIFGNVVSAILADYGKIAPSSLLCARRPDDPSPRNDIAMLDGARLVSINELPPGLQLDEQVLKQLAGREPISARFLYRELFTFSPSFVPWVRTNHKPIIRGDGDGVWRRIVVLPFNRKFEDDEQNPRLEDELLQERTGILRWMVEGAQAYLKSGLAISPSVKDEQAQYRKDSDLLGEFLEEKTDFRSDLREEKQILYTTWKNWCHENGAHAGTKNSFTRRLSERGIGVTKSGLKRYYSGIALLNQHGGRTGIFL